MPFRIGKAPQNQLRQNVQERRIAGYGVDALRPLAHGLGFGKFGLGQTDGVGRSHMKPLSAVRDAMHAALGNGLVP